MNSPASIKMPSTPTRTATGGVLGRTASAAVPLAAGLASPARIAALAADAGAAPAFAGAAGAAGAGVHASAARTTATKRGQRFGCRTLPVLLTPNGTLRPDGGQIAHHQA